MNFDMANIKSVKADIGKGEITVSFVVDLNSENLTEAECLRDYLATKEEDATDMTIDIYPGTHQMRLFPPDTKITVATPLPPVHGAGLDAEDDAQEDSDWQPDEAEPVDQPATTEVPY